MKDFEGADVILHLLDFMCKAENADKPLFVGSILAVYSWVAAPGGTVR
jgi:hypothetical protein